jgi:hypothetical protein
MDQNNSSGLSPVWLIALALVLGTTIVVLLPASIAGGDAIKASDWIGFAGNVVAGVMTIVAALIAWVAVQKQIGGQHKIAESQIAAQRVAILQDRLAILQDEYRLAWKLRSLAAVPELIPTVFLSTPTVTMANCDAAIKEFATAIATLEQVTEEIRIAETRRWSRNVGAMERSEIAMALAVFRKAEIANRQSILKLKHQIWESAEVISGRETAPKPVIDLSKETKAVDEKCLAYIEVVAAEISRLDELINESGNQVGL